MKRLLITTFIIFNLSVLAFADNKTVTIDWEADGSTQDVQNYTMIYSYKSDMSNPMVACSTNNNTATSLTCENVQITSTEVYFRIIAEIDQQSEVNSNIQHITVPVSGLPAVVSGVKIITSKPQSGVFDDFSTDTSGNYSFISGSMTIQNGAAHGETWKRTIGYHTTSLDKNDQTVSATCSFTEKDSSGIAVRINPSNQTGYFASITTSGVTLSSFSGTAARWVADNKSNNFLSPAKIELTVTGNNFVVKVNGVVQINTTDHTYSSGNYCGPFINRGMANSDITVDNFAGTAQ